MKMIKLGEALLYEQPTKYIVNSDNYDSNFKTPVLTAGKSFILGYTNETEGVFNQLPVIIFDDFTTAIKFVDFPFKVKSSAMKILSSNKEIADIKYMYYKMLTIKVNNDQHQRYWISKFANIQIPLPDLATQKAIAAKLDKADEIRQLNKKLIEQYDALTQSLFLDMFGDPVKNEKGWEKNVLGSFCQKIQIGPFGSQLHSYDYIEDGIPLVNPTNIKDDYIDYANCVKISEEKFNSLPNYQLITNDIVLARRGDLSKVGIVRGEKVTFCGTGSLFFRLSSQLNPQYVFKVLKSKFIIDYLYSNAQGVTMPNLNKSIVYNIPIVNPPITLQNEFAERVKAIEAQKALAQQALQQSENLFNSLLQESFK